MMPAPLIANGTIGGHYEPWLPFYNFDLFLILFGGFCLILLTFGLFRTTNLEQGSEWDTVLTVGIISTIFWISGSISGTITVYTYSPSMTPYQVLRSWISYTLLIGAILSYGIHCSYFREEPGS